jgi:hypothetical protein
MAEHGTSGGTDLTDELVQRLAAEAERGYAPDQLRPRMMLYTRLSEVLVSVLPEDNADYDAYVLKVRWCGGERHAVMHGLLVLGDGDWHAVGRGLESLYDYDTAYRLACQIAPTVEVDGRTAGEVAGGS